MTRRALIDPFVVGPPRAVSSRTRLFPSDIDETVLREIGDHLGGLLRSDLAAQVPPRSGLQALGTRQAQAHVDSTVFFSLGGRHHPGGG